MQAITSPEFGIPGRFVDRRNTPLRSNDALGYVCARKPLETLHLISSLGSAKSAPHPFVFNGLGTAFVPRGRGACNIGVRGLALLLGHAVRVGSVEERHGSRGLLGLQKNQKRPLKSPATSKKSFLTQMRLLLK